MRLILNCTRERARLGRVIRARKHIGCLVMLVLFLSSWASAAAPCAQQADASDMSQVVEADHSAHHAGSGSAEESDSGDCRCCNDCESMCVMSGCNLVALSGAQDILALNAGYAHFPQVDAFRTGPPPHVLYRPPIFAA